MKFKAVVMLSGLAVFGLTILSLTSCAGGSAEIKEVATPQAKLNEDPRYAAYINKKFRLKATESSVWQLKQSRAGQYHIQQSSANPSQTIICSLIDASIVIDEVFSDQNYGNNGEAFYKAQVTCKDKQYVAPVNLWTESFQQAIVFHFTFESL